VLGWVVPISNTFGLSDARIRVQLVPRSVEVLSYSARLDFYPITISEDPAVCVDIAFETGSKLCKIFPHAFVYSAVRHILIPASVQLVGDGCFVESNLCSIAFEETNDAQPPEVVIGQDVFACTSVQTIRFRENTVLSCNTLRFSGFDSVYMPCVFGSATPLEEPLDDEFLRTINRQLPFEEGRMIITRRFSLPDGCCARSIIHSIFFKPGCEVLVLGSKAFTCSWLQAIDIPDSVVKICDRCFEFCESLSSVTFGVDSRLQRIGSFAFYKCNLRDIEIPEDVSHLGKWCLAENKCLVSVFFRSDNPTPARQSRALDVPKLVEIPESIFHGDDSLRHITFPWHILKICDSRCTSFDVVVFSPGCVLQSLAGLRGSNLVRVVIPRSVRSLEEFCFSDCKSLVSIVFEEGSNLERIGRDACACTAITEIVIPRSVELLDDWCFYSCNFLTSIWIEGGSHLLRIGGRAFGGCAAVTLRIPASVTDLGPFCVSGSKALKQVIFEENSRLQTIADFSLADSSIRSIVIPASVSVLGCFCFSSCNSLTSVVFEAGSNLRKICRDAFDECSALESITLPESMIIDITQGLREKFPAMLAHFDGDIRGYCVVEPCFRECTSLKHVTFALPACASGRAVFTMLGVGYGSYDCLHLWQTLGFPADFDASVDPSYCTEALERVILQYVLMGFVIIDSSCFAGCTALETVRFVSPQLEKEISGADLHAFFDEMQFVIVSADGDSLARIATEQGMLPQGMRVFGGL
jgi:hypothetical protein